MEARPSIRRSSRNPVRSGTGTTQGWPPAGAPRRPGGRPAGREEGGVGSPPPAGDPPSLPDTFDIPYRFAIAYRRDIGSPRPRPLPHPGPELARLVTCWYIRAPMAAAGRPPLLLP